GGGGGLSPGGGRALLGGGGAGCVGGSWGGEVSAPPWTRRSGPSSDGGLPESCRSASRSNSGGVGHHGRGALRVGGREVLAHRRGPPRRVRSSGAVSQGVGYLRTRGHPARSGRGGDRLLRGAAAL